MMMITVLLLHMVAFLLTIEQYTQNMTMIIDIATSHGSILANNRTHIKTCRRLSTLLLHMVVFLLIIEQHKKHDDNYQYCYFTWQHSC